MFTGIIKSIGTVKEIHSQGGDSRITFFAEGIEWDNFKVGESIAVNGVCLTVIEIHKNGFDADVSMETMQVSTFASLQKGSRVNIEPSLAIGERMGGHFVTGHVDCIGKIHANKAQARSMRLEVELPSEFKRFVAPKGSICIDGVSFTINSITGSIFCVNVIPHTAKATIIGDCKIGDKVNIELDIMARYTERLLDRSNDGVISEEFLRVNGYE
ncbi:MAG: riboflavin synthase [Pseudomonadota bacterium]|nr:riboflavin synthase [Pseudomonadota bacterium]